MKNHVKTARAHIVFAVVYVIALFALLAIVAVTGAEPDWRLPGAAAGLAIGHGAIAWGAWRGRNWARMLTLALAFPALLAVPLGTLVAILLISYCWPAWDGTGAARCSGNGQMMADRVRMSGRRAHRNTGDSRGAAATR